MNHVVDLLAFGLGSAWMLVWGSAALIPLAIHLWSRGHHEEAPWAATEYVLAALRQNARRMRLEQRLLLATRIAIPLLLAAAMSKPVINTFTSSGTSAISRPFRHTLLVIDGSYSMQSRVAQLSRFEQAQELARELVERGHQGDGVTVVLMTDPPQVVVESPAFDPRDAIAEIDNLRARDTGADIAGTLDLIMQTIRSTKLHHPRLQEHHVCFVTDLGSNTWQAISRGPVYRQIDEIAAVATIRLFKVGSDVDNMAITDLRQRDEIATTTGPVRFGVSVHNYGAVDVVGCQVDLLVDGHLADRQIADLPAHEERSMMLDCHFDKSGEHWVEARLAPDALEVDNRRYLAVPVRPALRVLCVSGKPASTRNVALALDSAPPGGKSPIETDVIPEGSLVEADLQSFDCLFICNVGRFDNREAALLMDILQSGRGVVIFLGDQVEPENYNSVLGRASSAGRILPARLTSLVPSGYFQFDPRDYRHPIVSPFRGHQRTGLLTTPSWRYVRLEIQRETEAEIALWFTSGDPAIVEEKIGNGRCILVATAASEQSIDTANESGHPWTTWSAWPSFPPLIHEMAVRAAGTRFANRNLLVGETMQSDHLVLPRGVSVTINSAQEADQSEEFVTTTAVIGGSTWVNDQTDRSGVYVVSSSEPAPWTQTFAVNITADQESELKELKGENLPRQFVLQTTPVDEDRVAAVGRQPAPVFRMLLAAMLAMLVLETAVAWYLGNVRQ